LNARNENDKAIKVGESNDTGVWGAEPPAAEGIREIGGGAPHAEAIFIAFFKKMRIF